MTECDHCGALIRQGDSMKKVWKSKTFYRCGMCKTDHERRSDAEACEAGTVEEKKFNVGDHVRTTTRRMCVKGHDYAVVGTVTAIVGPELYDAEVHGKGFGLWLSPHSHIYMYEIATRCTKCRDSDVRVRYPASCLK